MQESPKPPSYLYSHTLDRDGALVAGFPVGAKGPPTSRTLMFAELRTTLAVTPANATRSGYATAIIDENCLGKSTTATRRLTNQRLGELYALEPRVPLFRILRQLWGSEEAGQPLLAL